MPIGSRYEDGDYYDVINERELPPWDGEWRDAAFDQPPAHKTRPPAKKAVKKKAPDRTAEPSLQKKVLKKAVKKVAPKRR